MDDNSTIADKLKHRHAELREANQRITRLEAELEEAQKRAAFAEAHAGDYLRKLRALEADYQRTRMAAAAAQDIINNVKAALGVS